jgi:hypothetical protein
MHSVKARHIERLQFSCMAISDWGDAAFGLRTNLARYYQWVIGLILHSGADEWNSRWKDCALKRAAAGWSFIPYVVYPGHGCVKPHGCQSCQTRIAAATFSTGTATSYFFVCGRCSSLPPPRGCWYSDHNGHSSTVWWVLRSKNQPTEVQCAPNKMWYCRNSRGARAAPCELAEFPCKYLGLPLSKKFVKRAGPTDHWHHSWSTSWLESRFDKSGRKVQVQFVLTSKLIYSAMVVDFPQWFYKTVDKIRRGYNWWGRREAKGGHCLVTWSMVCQPLQHMGVLAFLTSQS